MSVLACDRKGCENIMCDLLIWESQHYICNDCRNEFIKLHKHKQFDSTAEIVNAIIVFMQTNKCVNLATVDSTDILNDFFNSHYRDTGW